LSTDIILATNHKVEIKFLLEAPFSGLPQQALLKVTGTFDEVVRSLTQLCWITASFRVGKESETLHSMKHVMTAVHDIDDGVAKTTNGDRCLSAKEDDIMMSYVRFEEMDGGHSSESPQFSVSLCLPTRQSMAGYLFSDPGTKSCWLPLLKGGVLARGFPVRNRDSNSKGLELPFALMVMFAKAESSVNVNGDFYLIGTSWILILTRMESSGFGLGEQGAGRHTQWHLAKITDIELAKTTERGFLSPSTLQDLTEHRTFLGYFQSGFVLPGTEGLLHSNKIRDSTCPEANSKLEFAREGTVGAGISIKGIISVSGSTKWVLPKGLSASFEETHDFDDRLEQACSRPILVYDFDAKSAWLVSELSMVLHMALVFLEEPKVRDRRQPEEGPWPQLPYAQPWSDGGLAAYETIRSNAALHLYTRTEDKQPVKFWSVIDRFLRDLGTLRTTEALRQSGAGRPLLRPRLQGWDFHDLVNRTERIFKRELPKTCHNMVWWRLADSTNVTVIFGSNFGQLIQPNLLQTGHYPGWKEIPNGADLLTASMPALKSLAKKHNTGGLCNNLGRNLLWHRPQSLIDHSKSASCDRNCVYIQEIRQFPQFLQMGIINPPQNLINMEVIVFGDVQHYHKCQLLSAADERVPEDISEIDFSESDAPLTPAQQERMSAAQLHHQLWLNNHPNPISHIAPIRLERLYQRVNSHIEIRTTISHIPETPINHIVRIYYHV
jgi:hypothetical protein